MTTFPTPIDGRFEDMIVRLQQRVATLESQVAAANGAFAMQPVTSSTHPANPVVGAEILETDTGLTAYWSGSAWVYPPQLIGEQSVAAAGTAAFMQVPVVGSWSSLTVKWTGRSNNVSAATGCNLTFNNATTNYLWQQTEGNNSTLTTTPSGGTAANIHIGTMPAANATASYFGHGQFSVGTPSGSNFKVAVGEAAGFTLTTDSRLGIYGGQWNSAAAITLITLTPAAGSWVGGSWMGVYGEP